jgi:integrase
MHKIRKYAHGRWYECRPNDRGVFTIFWTEGRRSRRQSTGQRDLLAAQAFFDEWLTLEQTPAQALTCADIWALKYGKTSRRNQIAWDNLQPHFGAKRPGEITPADEVIYARSRGAAQSTVRLELSLLRASWNHAVKTRVLSVADLPALGPLPLAAPPRDRWLRDDEVKRLFAAAEGAERLRLFLWLALETGARRGAIQGLTWGQVDFEIGVIHYLPEGARQTRKRKASVPISTALRPVLEAAYAAARPRAGDLVIGPGNDVNQSLGRLARRAGITGVTPHVLRHTAATRMARQGVSLWLIAQVLGNTVQQVEKVYAKYQPDMARAAVEAISGRAA